MIMKESKAEKISGCFFPYHLSTVIIVCYLATVQCQVYSEVEHHRLSAISCCKYFTELLKKK